ncbi:DciA family protein [Bergeyella sp. RCAD1439]|uniref:DciA family protein n=1 Tax=Bergeyella anatis TaxID=3113737 RepID=UPI002E193F97|nr:DciA family protein [Bergeyella sp. RCAD1439]
MRRKKREYQSSDLVKTFAKIHGFEDKLLAFEVKAFLKDYLDQALYNEIESVNLQGKTLTIAIKSPLLKNDFRMRQSFFLKKFNDQFGEEKFNALRIL